MIEYRPLRIALLGAGSVGAQVARLLLENREELAARVGAELELIGIAVRDVNAKRPEGVPAELLTTDAETLILGADIVIEHRDVRELTQLAGVEVAAPGVRALNPVFDVGKQLCEPLIKHLGLSARQAMVRAEALLAGIGRRYPSPVMHDVDGDGLADVVTLDRIGARGDPRHRRLRQGPHHGRGRRDHQDLDRLGPRPVRHREQPVRPHRCAARGGGAGHALEQEVRRMLGYG